MGVGSKAPTPAVLGECGRDRIYLTCYLKCIKYWLKLISLPEVSLLKACYNLLYEQSQLGKVNWASKVRDILFRYGFGYVWVAQAVEDHASFLFSFNQCLKDCELQLWSIQVEEMSKLNTYRMFKTSRDVETYLSLSIPRRLRVALARFRISNHNLEVELGRHYNMAYEDRLCKLCGLENKVFVENEFHVVFECASYTDIRKLYIVKNVPDFYNFDVFVNLMSSTNVKCITNLANFIVSMNKIRQLLTQSCI